MAFPTVGAACAAEAKAPSSASASTAVSARLLRGQRRDPVLASPCALPSSLVVLLMRRLSRVAAPPCIRAALRAHPSPCLSPRASVHDFGGPMRRKTLKKPAL